MTSSNLKSKATIMASAVGRAAGKASGPISKIAGKAAESGKNPKNQEVLQKGAKRDPELYVGYLLAFNMYAYEIPDSPGHHDRCLRASWIPFWLVTTCLLPRSRLNSSYKAENLHRRLRKRPSAWLKVLCHGRHQAQRATPSRMIISSTSIILVVTRTRHPRMPRALCTASLFQMSPLPRSVLDIFQALRPRKADPQLIQKQHDTFNKWGKDDW